MKQLSFPWMKFRLPGPRIHFYRPNTSMNPFTSWCISFCWHCRGAHHIWLEFYW